MVGIYFSPSLFYKRMCECPICYTNLDAAVTGKAELSCGHAFHLSCLSKWFHTKADSSCPMCRKNLSGLEDVHKPQAVATSTAEDDSDDDDDSDDSDDSDDDELDFDDIPLHGADSAKIIEMLGVLGATGIQPGFEQCLDALITYKKPITRETFNRLCTKIGCRSIDILEWKRITVRVTALCIDAEVIYDNLNDDAQLAYEDLCNSLWHDRIKFTVSEAEKRLGDWIQDPTLPGAKSELVDSYNMVLQTWRDSFGPASPLEPLFADEIVLNDDFIQ